MRRFLLIFVFSLILAKVHAQFTYGTTGLLNMPTANMQRDKTLMVGGGFLEKHTTPARWTYDTYNYYLSLTFFPWLEMSYTCTLHKAMENDPAYGKEFWVPSTYGKFVNQDRMFSVRIRIWEEGWWKEWTPQVVVGLNDFANGQWNGKEGGKIPFSSSQTNGFYNRGYIAVSKHINFQGTGNLGIHTAYVYNKRKDYHLKGPCIGSNFQFIKVGSSLWNKILNGVNLMAEYDSRTINVGVSYSVWKDHINLIAELNDGKYFSGGVFFKVHLK